jgi:AP endonuclease 2
MFDILETDIIVIQEAKIQLKDLRDDMVLVPGWDVYFSLPRHKKGTHEGIGDFSLTANASLGYSGVAIYTRNSRCCPIRAEEGITGALCPPNSTTRYRDLPTELQIGGYPKPGQLSSEVEDAILDSEGRCLILEFPAFVLIGVYSPANRNSSRDDFRLGFLDALDVRIRNLVAAGKQVILTGDLNVVRSVKDVSNLEETLRKEGMTVEDYQAMPSRRLFNQLLFGGNVVGTPDEGRTEPILWDICREFHPTREGMYTCWDTKRNTRPANNGSRIDYVLCTNGIKDWFEYANIQEGLMGSDHCPVYATFRDIVHLHGKDTPLADLMNPPGMFQGGARTRDWSQKDLLPLSARLIPEFDRRRNIRDMFLTKPQGKPDISSAIEATDSNTNIIQSVTPTATEASPLPVVPPLQAPTSLDKASEAITKLEAKLPEPKTESPVKRPAEPTVLAKRSNKRTKGVTEREAASKGPTGMAQSSLKGFFKPKTSTVLASPKAESQTSSQAPSPEKPASKVFSRTSSIRSDTSVEMATAPSLSFTNATASESQMANSDRVFDPIVAKESWSRLLGKRVVPRCEHNEPCISLVTKKPGVNCGTFCYLLKSVTLRHSYSSFVSSSYCPRPTIIY